MSSRLCTFLGLALSVVLHGIAAAAPFAYVTNAGSDTFSVIDIDRNVVATTIQVGSSPQGVAFNKAGTRVYVANAGSNSVSVIDGANNSVIATIPVGVEPSGVAVNAAGTRSYVANDVSNNVTVIDAESNAGISLNAAGKRIYVVDIVNNVVVAIDIASRTVIARTPVGLTPAALGQFIAPVVAPAPNHRFVTSFAERQNMINQKWTPEGSGSGVGMCVPQ